MKNVSDKRRAKLQAEGVTYLRDSFSPKAKDAKPKRKPVGRGSMPQRRSQLAKVGKQKAKRQKANAEYYRSAEWRAKRKAVFERDGYQCVEKLTVRRVLCFQGEELAAGTYKTRCPTRGEIVNGKQTARGLVAEEKGYQHRGHPDAIDRIVTRCRECDRRLTPLERANHFGGFNHRGTDRPRGAE